MRQTRDFLELKAFIQRCRRTDLDKLIKFTNLPRGGLKQDIQLRLISYLDQDPSTEFLSALRELKELMYSPVNLQSQQSNGYSNASCPSSEVPASLMYLSGSTIRSPTESSNNNTGLNPCLKVTEVSSASEQDQLRHNPYIVQPNMSVFGPTSLDGLNSTKSGQQQSLQKDSSTQLPQSSMSSGNLTINSSVWTAWDSVNQSLSQNRVTTSQSCISGKFQNLSNPNQTYGTSFLPIPSNSSMSDGHSKMHVQSEYPQNSIPTSCIDSKRATVAHKIGPLITLAGAC
ncbi:unnamed protein product [Schistosoma turkestanicum]|nr:unnamed protein product [Schistosoma turkestanicum]